MAEHDAIRRALAGYEAMCQGPFVKRLQEEARAQFDALLAENARLREALEKLVTRVHDVAEFHEDMEEMQGGEIPAWDLLAIAFHEAKALLAPEESHG